MSVAIATWLVRALAAWLGVGLVFAVAFAWRGAARIDPDARAGTLGFRLSIVPGAAALWPLLLARWLRGGPPPAERNAHRDAARTAEEAP